MQGMTTSSVERIAHDVGHAVPLGDLRTAARFEKLGLAHLHAPGLLAAVALEVEGDLAAGSLHAGEPATLRTLTTAGSLARTGPSGIASSAWRTMPRLLAHLVDPHLVARPAVPRWSGPAPGKESFG